MLGKVYRWRATEWSFLGLRSRCSITSHSWQWEISFTTYHVVTEEKNFESKSKAEVKYRKYNDD